ncbi:MAG: phosphatase PAP2 family protein [bacterium]|nr:phosphatase PAP2 family protein [bacterium]
MNKKHLEIIAHSGDSIIWIGFSVIMLLSLNREIQVFGLMIAGSTLIASILSSLIKIIFRKERPIKDEYKQYAPWAKYDMSSFPSGHLSRISAVAFTLGYFFPFTLIVMGPYVCLMWYSRQKLGYHYFSDLAGGIVVGIISAAISAWVKLSFNI